MEKCFQDQLERIDRLMKIILSDDQDSLLGAALTFEDAIFFTCQSMWHLKDWILNDPNFQAKNIEKLKADIHAKPCLLICADLANGSKHLTLTRPKVGATFTDRQGIELHTSKGIYKIYYYVICTDMNNQYYGAEIRKLLVDARRAWDEIIDVHYLSIIDGCGL
jgi:hypothetical protein